MSDAASAAWSVGAPAMAVVEVTIPGASPMRGRLYRPTEADDLPLIIFVHGGGWTFGSLETHDGTMRELAVASGCAVFGFDYRLAPEHPFPAPLDDIMAAIAFAAGRRPRPACRRRAFDAGRGFGGGDAGAVRHDAAAGCRPGAARGCGAVLRLLRPDLRHVEPSRRSGTAIC